MVRNLQRVRHNWDQMSRVLVREGADTPALGRTYVAVVQAVLLHWLERWTMAPRIGRVLGGLHLSVAPRMKVQQPKRGWDGRWVYPLLMEAMED